MQLITIMGSVGGLSAYAVSVVESPISQRLLTASQTDIVAVQRVFYDQTYNFSCKYLLGIIWMSIWHDLDFDPFRSVDDSYVHPTHRIFHRRDRSTLPRSAACNEWVLQRTAKTKFDTVHSLACQSRPVYPFQHIAFEELRWCWKPQRSQPRTIFLLLFHMLCLLVSVPLHKLLSPVEINW